MALQEYGRLRLFAAEAGGALVQITQVSSIDIQTESGNIPVDLLNEGLGGFSKGSGRVRVTIGFYVPVSGVEFPFQQAAVNGALVTLQVGVGPESYVGTGKVMTEGVSQSTNASAEGTVEWEGELKARE